MKYLFLFLTFCYSLKDFYYPQTKNNNDELVPIPKEENDNCDGLKKGFCMMEPLCGWCMSKQKCVFSDEKVVQTCTQIDTYVFDTPDDKWDPYSYNHNVEFNSKTNKIQVNGVLGKTELDITQELPGIKIKTKRRKR